MADVVADAVAAAEQQPQTVRMVRREFTAVTGRPFAIEYPVDIQLVEMLAIIGVTVNEIPRRAEADRLAAAGIVLPTAAPAGLLRT